MWIVLNGERREFPGPLSVQTLLDELQIDARVVAVEVNRRIVKRAEYAETLVTEHVEVEIVAFVGGGHPTAGGCAKLTP